MASSEIEGPDSPVRLVNTDDAIAITHEGLVSPETIVNNDDAPENTHQYVLKEKTETWFRKLSSEGTEWYTASTMVMSNQMSQMLLLLPSCVAKLGWWRATLGTIIFGLLSCWTAHLVQCFYFRYYRKESQYNEGDEKEFIQWDQLLSYSSVSHGPLKKLGMLGMGFNLLCLLTRSIIQLTYSVSIIYFVNEKLEKRNWTYALASCCIMFAIVPTFRKYRIVSLLSFVTATLAALTIAVASFLHQQVQGVKHSATSSSIRSLAWVSSTIVYAFGDTSASVETLQAIEWDKQKQFKYAFWGSTAYTTAWSLLAALSSYRAFGDQLSEIPPAGQPCVLALLSPSLLRDIASISLLILELVTIGYSLYPLFMYIKRIISLLPCLIDSHHFLHRVARASIVALVCVISAAIPFSGSMEITSLLGSLIVSMAIYIIPALAHMLYFRYSRHRKDANLRGFSLIASYTINIILFAGVLIFVTIMGGRASINKVFHSHKFHRSDFWNRCYLCADLQLPPAIGPINAPTPAPQFLH